MSCRRNCGAAGGAAGDAGGSTAATSNVLPPGNDPSFSARIVVDPLLYFQSLGTLPRRGLGVAARRLTGSK